MIRALVATNTTKPTSIFNSTTNTSSVKSTPTLIPAGPTSCRNLDLNNDISDINTTMQPTASTTNNNQSSSLHCASLSSANYTVNTVSTNNTLNSLNHNNAGEVVQSSQSHPISNNCDVKNNSEQHSIPSGYSVHIKASNNGQSNYATTTTTTTTTSNNVQSYDSTVPSNAITSGSSTASSPRPANNDNGHSSSAGSFSSTTASSTFNQLPTLASSDSLNAFNFFDGLALPPAPTVNSTSTVVSSSITNTTSQSPLTTALFNTNPPTTTNTLNPLTSNNIVTDETVAQIVSNTSVPEFLYQLTKMLTDDHRDIIEWSNGKIEVHNPTKLEKEVLNQYFRHSKYASFQRQLNYFGFRKLAGKGKMAPCSYVNENATSDLRSLLRMKRKTSANAKDGKANDTNNSDGNTKSSHGRSNSKKSSSNKRARTIRQQPQQEAKHPYEAMSKSGITIAKKSGIRHQLNNYGATSSSLQNLTSSTSPIASISNPLVPDPMTSLDPVSIAKAAVGKGVTHQYNATSNTQNTSRTNTTNNNNNNAIGISNSVMSGIPTDSSNKFTFLDPSQLGMGMESYMSELQTNFRNAQASNDFNSNNNNQSVTQNSNQCSLPRESSLVDLAIIPSLTSALPQAQTTTNYTSVNKSESDYGMTFIDFPMDNTTLPPEE